MTSLQTLKELELYKPLLPGLALMIIIIILMNHEQFLEYSEVGVRALKQSEVMVVG